MTRKAAEALLELNDLCNVGVKSRYEMDFASVIDDLAEEICDQKDPDKIDWALSDEMGELSWDQRVDLLMGKEV